MKQVDRVVYSPLKVFAFPDHLARGTNVHAPVHVRIKPINACNHSCWFCAYRASGLTLGEDMRLRDRIPFDKLCEIADDLIDMGVQAVTFSGGGEPLLYPRIAEIIERLGQAGIRIGTLTNGSYLLGEVADALARYASWVRVSMDGWDDESYSRLRSCKPGEFTRIINNMRAFAERKSACDLGVSFIVGRDNADRLTEVGARVKTLGAQHIKLSPCIVGNDAASNNTYHEPILETVYSQIDALKQLNDDSFEVVDHYHRFDELFAKSYTTCPMLEYLTIIAADCSVYTCQDKAYSQSGLLGSIAGRTFKSFWFSEENAMRIRSFDPSTQCQHHCVGHQKNRLLLEYRNLDKDHVSFV